MARLSEEQATWLQGGLVGMLATVGARSRPTVVRVFGQRPCEDGTSIDFCIASADAQACLDDLGSQPLAALNLVCPRAYRSLQFKGPCGPTGRPWPEPLSRQCVERANEALGDVGMPPDAVQRLLSHYANGAMLTLRMRVEEVFDQSPGPRAGARL